MFKYTYVVTKLVSFTPVFNNSKWRHCVKPQNNALGLNP